MHHFKESDGDENRNTGGTTRVKEIWMESVGLKEEGVSDMTKWQNHNS